MDKDGYFIEDFNKKVAITNDFKIYSDTIQSFWDVKTTSPNDIVRADFKASFYSIDLARTI